MGSPLAGLAVGPLGAVPVIATLSAALAVTAAGLLPPQPQPAGSDVARGRPVAAVARADVPGRISS